jgi:hypothetical protein
MGCSRSSLIGLTGLTDPGIEVVLLVLTARRLFLSFLPSLAPRKGAAELDKWRYSISQYTNISTYGRIIIGCFLILDNQLIIYTVSK